MSVWRGLSASRGASSGPSAGSRRRRTPPACVPGGRSIPGHDTHRRDSKGAPMHIDMPTRYDVERLAAARDPRSVTVYLPRGVPAEFKPSTPAAANPRMGGLGQRRRKDFGRGRRGCGPLPVRTEARRCHEIYDQHLGIRGRVARRYSQRVLRAKPIRGTVAGVPSGANGHAQSAAPTGSTKPPWRWSFVPFPHPSRTLRPWPNLTCGTTK